MLRGSLALLSFFVWWELLVQEPRSDRHRSAFSWVNLLVIATTVALFSYVFYLSLFLQDSIGTGALGAALNLIAAALLDGVLMSFALRLFDRIDPVPLAFAGVAAVAFATFLMHGRVP